VLSKLILCTWDKSLYTRTHRHSHVSWSLDCISRFSTDINVMGSLYWFPAQCHWRLSLITNQLLLWWS